MLCFENAFGKYFSVKIAKYYFSNFEKCIIRLKVVPCKTMTVTFLVLVVGCGLWKESKPNKLLRKW